MFDQSLDGRTAVRGLGRIQGPGNLNSLSMTAVFSVIVVLTALVFLLAWALTWINAKYDDLTRRHPEARHTSPWLRSLRDEREVRYPSEVRDQLC